MQRAIPQRVRQRLVGLVPCERGLAVGFQPDIAQTSTTEEDNDGTDGFGLGAGAGFDGWVGDEWSLGGGLRLMYMSLTGESHASDDSTFSGFELSLSFLVTYH